MKKIKKYVYIMIVFKIFMFFICCSVQNIIPEGKETNLKAQIIAKENKEYFSDMKDKQYQKKLFDDIMKKDSVIGGTYKSRDITDKDKYYFGEKGIYCLEINKKSDKYKIIFLTSNRKIEGKIVKLGPNKFKMLLPNGKSRLFWAMFDDFIVSEYRKKSLFYTSLCYYDQYKPDVKKLIGGNQYRYNVGLFANDKNERYYKCEECVANIKESYEQLKDEGEYEYYPNDVYAPNLNKDKDESEIDGFLVVDFENIGKTKRNAKLYRVPKEESKTMKFYDPETKKSYKYIPKGSLIKIIYNTYDSFLINGKNREFYYIDLSKYHKGLNNDIYPLKVWVFSYDISLVLK